MVRQIGREVGVKLAALHEARGVDLRLGSGVSAIHGDNGAVAAVELLDGSRLEAQTVLVAVGSLPAVSWLEASGLPLGNGVICDAQCRAAEDVFAAGDVAEWFNPRFGRRMRVEHRMNANEQAAAVAANLIGGEQEFAPVPYFWSDQYDIKIQAHGLLEAEDDVVFDEAGHPEGRFAVLYTAGGIVQGVLGWGIPRAIRRYRDAVGNPLAAQPGG
jgi:NADPH-dependent 2,4-dienoyl-CoA reductase/sulfur reductase-like enzyme